MRVTPEDCLRQLAAREALRVQVHEYTCPPLLDQGPNPLWKEVQSLTKERDALTARVADLEDECDDRINRCCFLQEQIQELKSQLAASHARAVAFQQEADVQRQRIGKALAPTPFSEL